VPIGAARSVAVAGSSKPATPSWMPSCAGAQRHWATEAPCWLPMHICTHNLHLVYSDHGHRLDASIASSRSVGMSLSAKLASHSVMFFSRNKSANRAVCFYKSCLLVSFLLAHLVLAHATHVTTRTSPMDPNRRAKL
jgi:hypothetical protein